MFVMSELDGNEVIIFDSDEFVSPDSKKRQRRQRRLPLHVPAAKMAAKRRSR